MSEKPADNPRAAERIEALRRRIALYRDYLREGVSAGLAAEYLREIAAAEAEIKAAAARQARRDRCRSG